MATNGSLFGTQDKCTACEKTVYFVDRVVADGVTYHKTCFRCHHCKRTLQLSDYSSLDGVLYCKPHVEQLFKLARSFNKLNFDHQPATPRYSTTPRTRICFSSPSKMSFCFLGTQDVCILCGKKVYPLEKVSVEERLYHKSCFRCVHGGCALNPSNYAALEGRVYCKHHYSQLFLEKGDYRQLEKVPPIKPSITKQATET